MNRIPSSLFPFLWHYIKKQRWGFLFLLFTTLVWGTNEALFPYFIKLVVNGLENFQGPKSDVFSAIKIPLFCLIGFWLFMDLCMRAQGWGMYFILPKFKQTIRSNVFSYVKEHSFEFFSNNFAGSIANKVADLPSSAERILEIGLFLFAPVALMLSLSTVLMYRVQPFFGLIFLSWAALHFLIQILFLKKITYTQRTHAEALSGLSGRVVDSLSNITSVRLFSRSRFEQRYFEKFQSDEVSKNKSALATLEYLKLAQGILGDLLIVSFIILLVRGWAADTVTLGDFAFIGMGTFSMMGLVWWTSFNISMFMREAGRINAALQLVSQKHAITDAPNAPDLRVPHGEILFQNVCFKYAKGQHVFENMNLRIAPGQKVGLVGLSGSGKSTCVNLILRFFDVDSGHILIDNQNTALVTQDSLRSAIAMIPQDPSLFHRTIMENIRYGRIEATDEEVIHAAKLAHCHEFITLLEKGYDTEVGERGVKLSGGQRQRIAIARAILKNAPILILDEATSALDSITERLIQESLDDMMQGKTTIVIAHRLSTLAHMDRILVFENGTIVEDGSMEALLEKGGHFKHLWTMQTDGFLPDKPKAS